MFIFTIFNPTYWAVPVAISFFLLELQNRIQICIHWVELTLLCILAVGRSIRAHHNVKKRPSELPKKI